MYDRFGRILGLETTLEDVSFSMKCAPMKKTIYSLGALREVLSAANWRYLEFLSAIDDPSNGIDKLDRTTRRAHHQRGAKQSAGPQVPRKDLTT